MHATVLRARGYKEVYNIVEEFIASRGRETDAYFWSRVRNTAGEVSVSQTSTQVKRSKSPPTC